MMKDNGANIRTRKKGEIVSPANRNITYSVEKNVDFEEVRNLWLSSGFSEYVPDFDWNNLRQLLENSNLIVVARHNGKMVGMTRSVTDFTLYCGLVDIMVDPAYQRQGIATELAKRTRDAAGCHVWLSALVQDSVCGFYKKAGFIRVENGWSAWILMPPPEKLGHAAHSLADK